MPRPALAATLLSLLCLAVVGGCATAGGSGGDGRDADFRPAKLRLHPSFTQIQDWTGDKVPDGIDVVIEMLDSYDDPTKGRGSLLLELWGYRRFSPNILGPRAAEPWRRLVVTREEQVALWNGTLRAYTFQLPLPGIDRAKGFVLTASFQPTDTAGAATGPRLYDRLILEGKGGKPAAK